MPSDTPPATLHWQQGETDPREIARPAAHERRHAIRLVTPGQDDPAARLEKGHLLNGAIAEFLEQRADDELELLIFPSDDGELELVLSVQAPRDRQSDLGGAVPIDEDGRVGEYGETPRWVEALVSTLETNLPTGIGIEHGGLDFTPLGPHPMPTARMMVRENHGAVDDNALTHNALAKMIAKLRDATVPFIIQVMVSTRGNSDLLLSVRQVTFDPDTMLVWPKDFLRHIKEGHPHDPCSAIGHMGLNSSYQLPLDDFVRVGFDRVFDRRKPYRSWSDTRAAKRSVRGHAEYADLLGGRMGADPIYQSLGWHPTIPIERRHLGKIAMVLPWTVDAGLWSDVPGRDQPVWTTRSIYAEAAGTDQATGTDRTPAIPRQQAAMANEGTRIHQDTGISVEEILLALGYDVWEAEGDGPSHPDFYAQRDGPVLAVEISKSTKTKPGAFLTNVERAIEDGHGLLVIANDKGTIDRWCDCLLEPFREHTDTGVRLYHRTETIELTDGSIPVRPTDTDIEWHLAHDGTLTLQTGDGEALASGQGDGDIRTFDFAGYRLVEASPGVEVQDASGTTVATFPDATDMPEGWSPIYYPLVPSRFELVSELEAVQLGYLNDHDELVTVDIGPEWTTFIGIDGERLKAIKAGVRDFEGRYFVEVTDAQLPLDDYYASFNRWVEPLAGIDPPARHVSGKGREISDSGSNDGDGDGRTLDDHTYVFPPGLHSPHLPFRDADPE